MNFQITISTRKVVQNPEISWVIAVLAGKVMGNLTVFLRDCFGNIGY